MKQRLIYTFGAFRLDATAKVLLRDEEPVRLTRKAIETLLALVENCGVVLTKEELMHTVWPDRVVDEANLAQNIAVIRKALGVEHGAPGCIETFPGRGYRIIGPVTVTAAPHETPAYPAAPLPPRRFPPRAALAAGAGVVAAAAALVWLLAPAKVDSSAEELRRAPVTRMAGKEDQPAVSPDGKAVAFVWERTEGAAGIWVQESGRDSPRQISAEDGVYSSPAWSPDGRRLAYMRFRHSTGALLVRSLEIGEEREIASVFYTRYGLPCRHLDWSPDGRYLVIDDAAAPRQALGIYLVSLETGEKKQLTHPPSDEIIGDVDPRFSPDGTTVSFIRAFHRTRLDLFAVARLGGAPLQLTSDGKQITSQDWSSDGKRLIFSSDRSGEFRLWVLDYVPAKGASTPRRLPIYADFPLQVALSRHAPVLVYSVLQQDRNIWRLDLAAKADAPGRWERVVASSGQDASPQYSPQGDKISFRSDRSGEEQLWVAASDGSDPVQITQGTLNPSVPRWSPDGRAIVFNNAKTREISVARLGADGGWSVSPLKIIGVHPVFSRDGLWIFAATDSIIRVPAHGGPVSEVAKIRGISLDLSPDGRYLYFVREPSGTQLWRLETATGRTEKVLDGLVPFCSSCWALGSGGIYYLGAEDDSLEKQALRFRDLNTGRDRKIIEYPEPLSPIGSGPFSLSPDGRYLLCVRLDPSNADIFRVEPFR